MFSFSSVKQLKIKMRCTKTFYLNLLLTVFSRIPNETYIVQIMGFLIYEIVFYPSTNCNELC